MDLSVTPLAYYFTALALKSAAKYQRSLETFALEKRKTHKETTISVPDALLVW